MDTEMEFEAYSNLTSIQSFFYGKCVFLTGVTGLVGKVVLEKLLRSCPGIGVIYIHMRPKKGLTAQQRLDKLFKLELFKELKKVLPHFRKYVQVIEGDITESKLGISLEDWEKLRDNVSIVIHSAASVNFKDTLKNSVEHNIVATKCLLELCKEMPNIEAVVHVSTAFVQREPDGTVLEEVPKTKVSPSQILDAFEWMDEKSQEAVSDFLTEKILTTYLVTKAMAEVLIQENRGNLPVAIVRPAYIGPTFKEPFPGWIDQLQGLSGLLLAGAKGVLRALVSVKDLKINIIPVDIVSNSIITSAWHMGTSKPPNIFILNCVMDYEKLPNADEEILKFALLKRGEYPLVRMFRYPSFTIYYNKYAYHVHALIDQWIPAVIIDFFLYIFTGRTILFKVYEKINFLYSIFYRLGKDPWICRLENYFFLKNKLSEEDSQIFTMNTDNFVWLEYIENCLLGGRKFLAKEDPSNIPYAIKKAKTWWAVTTALKWFIILYFFYYLFTRSFFSPFYESLQEKLHILHA